MTELAKSVQFLASELSCPVVLRPAGMQSVFHPQGELAVARAAKVKNHRAGGAGT